MNIVLIGMSGAGKSTLGVLLAKALGMDFVDTDIVIQQREGRLLQDILDDEGIDGFLGIEETAVSGLAVENCVVATGGSVVYSRKTMEALRRGGIIVYLHVSFEEVRRRLAGVTSRGIVMRSGFDLRDVYEERVPLYRRYGDRTFDCTGRDVEDCVRGIIEGLGGMPSGARPGRP